MRQNNKYKNNSYRSNKQFNHNSEGGDSTLSTDSHEPVQCQPLQVQVHDNFERAFRAFRALVQKERILSQYKERQAFEKPSDKARRLRSESQRKAMQDALQEENPKKFVRKEREDKKPSPQ